MLHGTNCEISEVRKFNELLFDYNSTQLTEFHKIKCTAKRQKRKKGDKLAFQIIYKYIKLQEIKFWKFILTRSEFVSSGATRIDTSFS